MKRQLISEQNYSTNKYWLNHGYAPPFCTLVLLRYNNYGHV